MQQNNFYIKKKTCFRRSFIVKKKKKFSGNIETFVTNEKLFYLYYPFSLKSEYHSCNTNNYYSNSLKIQVIDVPLYCSFAKFPNENAKHFLEPPARSISFQHETFAGMEPFYRNFVIGQRWKLKVAKTRAGFPG